jgi:lipoprotein-anchoring transpeptidase ErfK/SrfK
MPRWFGFLGSWAFFSLGLGLVSIAAAGEWINIRDSRRLARYALVDRLLADRLAGTVAKLQLVKEKSESSLSGVRVEVAKVSLAIDDAKDTDQKIMVSTSENRLYVRSRKETTFRAVCSTGKNTTLVDGARTKIFRTPIGRFRVRSKEENPVWVPPDWHYVEEARKKGLTVVRFERGQSIDADTGGPARRVGGGVWDWVFEPGGSRRVLTVKNGTIVESSMKGERELPPGSMIRAGKTLVIPPIGTPQRKFEKVLGAFRINLGDGYALHGTQNLNQLGQSVSHGCVRLGDADIEALYRMANVGDEVIIY